MTYIENRRGAKEAERNDMTDEKSTTMSNNNNKDQEKCPNRKNNVYLPSRKSSDDFNSINDNKISNAEH